MNYTTTSIKHGRPMKTLTLQIHHNDLGWLDAATLAFKSKRNIRLEYDIDYAAEYIGRRDRFALSVAIPVDLGVHDGELPAFVHDLIPQGEPLRRLLSRYSLQDENDYEAILSTIPLAPPGNIRVKEPWAEIEARRPSYQAHGFTRSDITERNRDFIDYMESSGAPIGGTSGAGGGSPKFLLREDKKGRLHAEGWLDDHKTTKAFLVKLPYSDSENSRVLAHVEKIYYDLLRELPLVTGDPLEITGDTLFITRFDRIRTPLGTLNYHGLESLYSAHSVNQYGARLRHEDNISLLLSVSNSPSENIFEYLKRDFVNQMLANTDNHGRNTSLLKKDHDVRLSPIYDVTAMQFFMGDIITELTRWDEEHQNLTARVDWLAQSTQLMRDEIVVELKKFARQCLHLEKKMTAFGIPRDIIDRSRPARDSILEAMETLA